MGFGVYVYASLPEAIGYAARGGWDQRLKDPVILVLEDESLTRVIPDSSWPASKYENMYWKDLEDGDEDDHWRPAHLSLLAPATPEPPVMPDQASPVSPRRSRRTP